MDRILLLSQMPGVGPKKIRELLLLGEDKIVQYLDSYPKAYIDKYIGKCNKILDLCIKYNIQLVKFERSHFPGSPLLLFLMGNSDLLFSNKNLGVVGSRSPRKEYLSLAKPILEYSVRNGFITLSGYAKGCDIFAHKISLSLNRPTISILPRGISPKLDSTISRNGLVVSEYPPDSPVYKYRCVSRNRLISGFSSNLLVIDAKIGSGSCYAVKEYVKKDKPFAYINFEDDNLSSKGTKIRNTNEFDLYLEKCIKYSNEKISNSSCFKFNF